MNANNSENRSHNYSYDHDEEIEYDHAPIIKQAKERLLARQLSLTEEEKVVLASLFVDKKSPSNASSLVSTSTGTNTNTTTKTNHYTPSLTDEMLFNHSILHNLDDGRDDRNTNDDEKNIATNTKPPLSPSNRPSFVRGRRAKAMSQPSSPSSLPSTSSSGMPPPLKPLLLKKTDKPKLFSSPSIPRPVGIMLRPKVKSTSSAITKSNTKSFFQQKNKPNSENHTALWLAHDKGLMPPKTKRKKKQSSQRGKESMNDLKVNMKGKKKKKRWEEIQPEEVIGDLDDDANVDKDESTSAKGCVDKIIETIHSNADDGVLTDQTLSRSTRRSDSTTSSLDEDYDYRHFDCWQLLKDEYAQDFGFAARDSKSVSMDSKPEVRDQSPREDISVDVESSSNDSDVELHQFKILGTGVDDISAQPHVLSPPLMDSLLNFVPDSHKFENFWLKYSMVRDGSCLDTFRDYTRAASNTILAIETTNGDVFGSFTTSPWENHGRNTFGNGNSFVWKMRLSRATNCSSLYDQAHIESEIDVFPYSGFNTCVQICTNSMIALGGAEIEKSSSLGFSYDDYQQLACDYKGGNFSNKNNEGFAIALHDDLSHGTTAPCPTFCSPSLLNDGGEFFEVLNLEVWTFTPVDCVNEAQQLEMRKYFVLQHNTSTGTRTRSSSEFSSKDLIQESFYHRLGR